VSYDATGKVATLTPSAALGSNTTYTANLTTAIKAGDGVALASNVSWTFTTVNGAPTVTAKTPADTATGVATSVNPTATFSRAMDATTITASSFTLTPSGGSPIAATVSYDATGKVATLAPAAALVTNTTYTATLTTAIKAADDVALASSVSWSFTTVNGAPTVTAKSPADTATGVATSVNPTATFSRAMDATTITTSSFTLTPNGGSPVAATVAYNSTTNVATLTPSAALANNTTYTATLTTTIKASDGVALASAVSWSFTTATGAPTVTAKTPADAATGVATSIAPTATFSRAMDATTLTSSTFTLAPTGGPAVAATVSYNSTTNVATLTPSAALASSTTYVATLTTGVKASDGVALTSAVTWSFTTIASTAGPVTSTNPADGASGVSTAIKPSATFSKPMNAASFTTTSFTIKKPDGSQVTALPSYDSATMTATLTPNTPLDFSKTFTVTLTTAVKDATGAALAAPYSWKFTTTGATDPIRLNAGGPAYTSGSGVSWIADAYFLGGSTTSTTNTISGTSDPALYQTQRVGTWRYNVPVPNGTYDVKLYFAETVYAASGKRVFGVDVVDTAGATADITNLDIFAQVGANAALVKTIPNVAITDGSVSLRGVASVDSPVINAVEVIPVPPTVTSFTPASGATGVARSTTVTATFSRAMDAASLNTSSFTLKGPGGVAVPATVSYNTTTKVVTLTPSSALAANTTYTARLEPTVRGADGMTLASPVTWSFTTGP
jgi:molybdopterin converting factor small subunit